MKETPFETKSPPQAIELEKAVLGAILNPIEKDIYWKVSDILTEKVFFDESNSIIYATIESMYASSSKVDIFTVENELKKSNSLEKVGGAYYLSSLSHFVTNTANIITHAHIIVEKYILRELIRISQNVEEKSSYEQEDCFDLLNSTISEINSITDYLTNNNAKTSKQIVKDIYDSLNKPKTEQIRSKYNGINNIIGQYESGNVYIYAGEPGHGKSLLATEEAKYISKTHPVLYFSLEMTAAKLVYRIVADLAGIPNNRLKNGIIYEKEYPAFSKAMGDVEQLKLFINDKPGLTMMQIYLIAKKMKYQHGLKAVFIDHFHLVKIKGRDKTHEYSENSAMLKVIAKDLDIPVIALFQMNRERNKRTGSKKPKLSDLREVGEQDADVVNFITRPELLEITELFDGTSAVNKIVVNNAKNRDGCVGDELLFDFYGDFQRLEEVKTEIVHPPEF